MATGRTLLLMTMLGWMSSFSSAQVRLLSHITRNDGGFLTQVLLESTSDQVSTYSLTPYASDGTAGTPIQGTLPSGTIQQHSVEALFGSTMEVSHVVVSGEGVRAAASYRAATGPGSPALVTESSIQARRFRIFPGDWSVVFDGFAVVNTGDHRTNVMVRQIAFDGTVVDSKTVLTDLAPMSKGLYVLGAPQGSGFQVQPDMAFEVVGHSDLSITALRGTPPNAETGFLWENTATPLAPLALEPLPLNAISTWCYQIQEVNLHDSVDHLVNSRYDMVVMEPTTTDWSPPTNANEPWARDFDIARAVSRLKDSPAGDGVHRKRVIAYIDIGQAEDWRWYWTWDPRLPDDDVAAAVCNQTPFPPSHWPEFIVKCDPDQWLHNYPVLYWYDAWLNIVIHGQGLTSAPFGQYQSILDQVLQSGFDGIYLDWVEAAEDEDIIAKAQAEGLDPVQEMIWFIEDMRTYARQRNPNFVIIQQNAASLVSSHEDAATVIDAIAQEAIWYDGDATDDWEDPNGVDSINEPSLTQYYLNQLQLYQAAGVPVFCCEYALDNADEAYTMATQYGFIPYVSRRSLSRLSTTPPPGY